MEKLDSLLTTQARRIFESGIIERTPMAKRNIGGDILPIILASEHQDSGDEYLYLGLKHRPNRTKIIPIGYIASTSEPDLHPVFNTFGYYIEEDLILAKNISDEIAKFCADSNIIYDREFGRDI